jgi:hypothetical protein
MADDLTTPIGSGTVLATKDLGGRQLPLNGISDQTGADAMGLVTASPDATTLLGRLKAIADAIISRLPAIGAQDAAESLSVTPSSDGFAVTVPAGATSAKQDELQAAIAATAPAFAITPHATNALERQIIAIAIVTGGDIVYRHPDDADDRTITLPAGFFPLVATHIRDTSSAEGLTGF